MTEKQIKQLESRNKQLREEYDSLNKLIERLELVQSQSDDVVKHQRYSGMSDLFDEVWRRDCNFITNVLIDKANLLIREKQSELENVSLLSILSEIEKVQ